MASFGKAFSAARKAGKKEFSWKGKSYTTKLAGETPGRAPLPSAAPRSSSGSPSQSRSIPTPTPRPSREAAPQAPKGRQMRSPRAVAGPSGEAMYGGSPKLPQRKPFGGSALGGLVKWGSEVKKRPAYRNPSPRAR